MSRDMRDDYRDRTRGERNDPRGHDGPPSRAPRSRSLENSSRGGPPPSDPNGGRRPSFVKPPAPVDTRDDAAPRSNGNGNGRGSRSGGPPERGPRSGGRRGGDPRDAEYAGAGRSRSRSSDPQPEQAPQSRRRSMVEMARNASRTMSRQLSAAMSRTGHAIRNAGGDSYGFAAAARSRDDRPRGSSPNEAPPRRPTLSADLLEQLENSPPYRRSRARLLARKWRLKRVRANPIAYAITVATIILVAALVAFGSGAGGIYAVGYYQSHVADIQQIANLKNHASTIIYDRNGNVLATIHDDSGFNYYVPLNQVSPWLQKATIDTEDPTFYSNVGIDFYGTARALVADATHGGAVQGGSTITQQLVKLIVAKDSTKSVTRKLNEAILAYGVTQQYTKAQILEMYLNTISYGGLITGIEAAARNYFGYQLIKNPDGSVQETANMQLTLAQAALLAGVPNSPTRFMPDVYSCAKAPCPTSQWANAYDPNYDYFTQGHEQAVLARTQVVLEAMKKQHDITDSQEQDALAQVQDMLVNQKIGSALSSGAGQDAAPGINQYAQHFVQYVEDELVRDGVTDPGSAGLRVYTTLDLKLQEYALQRLQYYIDKPHVNQWYGNIEGCSPPSLCTSLASANNANNGALLAMDQHTGDILAMVGSVNFNSKDPNVLGQNNITTSLRSLGSSTKPLVYSTALQMGWNGGVMMQDIPICFPTGGGATSPYAPNCKGYYSPTNYEPDSFSGQVPLRRALDNSLNIPATEAISFVGDGPSNSANLLTMAERLGVTSMTAGAMGPTTALGTQVITLLQLTNAYAAFADLGYHVQPRAILEIDDASGNVIWKPAVQGGQAISPQAAYMLTNILTDNKARAPDFGIFNPLQLGNPLGYSLPSSYGSVYPSMEIAAKTGTSSGTTGPNDIVTMGYSPYMTLGVWMGNTPGNDPMSSGIIGVAGAGYVFHDVMDWGATNYHWKADAQFAAPPDLASGSFNCNTGLAPYQGQTAPEACKYMPYPGYGKTSTNVYNADDGQSQHVDGDLYIQGQAWLQS